MAFRSHSLFRALVLLTVLAVPAYASDSRLEKRMVSTRANAPVASEPSNDYAPASNAIEGFTEPYADLQLAASEMGTLKTIGIAEGDTVKAGQVIASLDDRVLQASLKVAATAAKAIGEVNAAEASLAIREIEYQKLTELFGRNHASQRELDRVQGDLKVAQARLNIAKEESAVRQLEHDRILAQLQQRRIVSPIEGAVVEVMKETGEFVSPSDPVVARIVQLDPMLVAFSVPASQRSLLAKNQPVLMTVGKSTDVSGRIEFVSPIADASSGTFRVKIVLPNAAGRWLSGEKSVLHLDSDSINQAAQIDRLAKQTNK
ncbi:MAG: efflux RND transporter periplasmic adaptor subunit [Fuerstiella sp.]